MRMGEALLPEYDHEMGNTRKVLALVPADKLDWKAQESFQTIGWVAKHLAEIPSWVEAVLHHDQYDVAGYQPPELNSPTEILAMFDQNVAAGRAALAAAEDAPMMEPWSLVHGEKTFFTMPKAVVLRSFVFNHTVHHRAFLIVYLRLNGVEVPGMYDG